MIPGNLMRVWQKKIFEVLGSNGGCPPDRRKRNAFSAKVRRGGIWEERNFTDHGTVPFKGRHKRVRSERLEEISRLRYPEHPFAFCSAWM